MSTLSVSSIQNTASPVANIVLNASGSSTLALYNLGVAPTPVQTGTLWYNVSGAGLVIWNGSAWVGVGGGSGTVTGVTGTLPITVATGTTTPVIAINAATTALPGSIQLATAAENAAGTDATKAVTPAFSVPKDAAGMTGAGILPSGTTAQRPATPAVGMTRVNTTTNSPEAYLNGAWSPIQSTQSGQFAGFRNILINGNFAVNQRKYVSGTPTAVANQYTVDRWKVIVSGQSLSFSASGNGNQITAPAGGVSQPIEGRNIKGGVYTLSWTGTATAQVNGSPVANGGSVTLPANTLATVTFSSGTVKEAQLEPGYVATPFEERFIYTEVTLCQWYCQVFAANAGLTSFWQSGGPGPAASALFVPMPFGPMRAAPVITPGVVVTGSDYYLAGAQNLTRSLTLTGLQSDYATYVAMSEATPALGLFAITAWTTDIICEAEL